MSGSAAGRVFNEYSFESLVGKIHRFEKDAPAPTCFALPEQLALSHLPRPRVRSGSSSTYSTTASLVTMRRWPRRRRSSKPQHSRAKHVTRL